VTTLVFLFFSSMLSSSSLRSLFTLSQIIGLGAS
jgi:hypothetical protein